MTIEELLGIDGDILLPAEGWANQWGGVYGGYVAAALLHVFERNIPSAHSIAMAQVSFISPMRTETEARLRVEVHRSGSAATALTGRIEQSGGTAAVGMAWAAASIEQPSRVDVAPPRVRAPEEYEPVAVGDARNSFVDRDFDLRAVPTPDEDTRWLQWIRLTRLSIGEETAWPAAAVALVADMVGGGPYRAVSLTLGQPHATMALDLTIHFASAPVGPWVLGVFDNLALTQGRGLGRGELYDGRGSFAATVTQQSLVRPVRST